jgi:uncharacterized protein YdcH (DUF465 family)
MNKTLNSLFDAIPVYENKIVKFLETCYNYAWSYRATAKELGINHKTVKNILESIKNTPQYYSFMGKLEVQIQNFSDPKFSHTIFDRYEEQLKDIEDRIKKADKSGDKTSLMNLLRLKTTVLKDQLKASLVASQHKNEAVEIADAISNMSETAWEEYNEKVQ